MNTNTNITTLTDIALPDDYTIYSAITEYMKTVGIPAHIKGYAYIREAIALAVKDIRIMSSVTKDLYPAVADRCGTTPSRVERAVRHAIEVAFDRGDIDILMDIFGNTFSPSKGKPTNSEFIVQIATSLRLRFEGQAAERSTFDLAPAMEREEFLQLWKLYQSTKAERLALA